MICKKGRKRLKLRRGERGKKLGKEEEGDKQEGRKSVKCRKGEKQSREERGRNCGGKRTKGGRGR